MRAEGAVAVELRSLREEAEEKDARIRKLSEALAPTYSFPTQWRLTTSQTRILARLYRARGQPIRREAMLVSSGTTGTLICLMRKKLRPYGISIETAGHEGYYLDKTNHGRITEAIEKARIDLIAEGLPVDYDLLDRSVRELRNIAESCTRLATYVSRLREISRTARRK